MLVLIFSLLFSPAPQRMGWCQAHLGFVFPLQASFKASSWLVQRFIPQRILNPIKSAITINRHKMVILFSIFLKELYTDSCRECTSLHSYQQCMRVLPRLTFPQKRNAMRAFLVLFSSGELPHTYNTTQKYICLHYFVPLSLQPTNLAE